MHEPASLNSRDFGRFHARVLLIVFALVAAFFVAVTVSPWRSGFADAPARAPSDIELYQAEAQRIRNGQSYYDAKAEELAARGYPTHSVFNWRTPLPVWPVALLPEQVMGNVLLGAAALALVMLSFQLLADEGGVNQGLTGVLLLAGALLPCFLGDLVLATELWSGVLVALSAVCYGVGRSRWGVAAGVAALFFRELAAPYCLLCMALAAGERRYRELACWSAAVAAYGMFYALHLGQVLPRMGSAPTVDAEGWIRFGGAAFLISTAQMNAFLVLVPQWVAAVYLAGALLGAATWNTPGGRRIGWTVALYVVAFGVAGNDYNQYWGWQIAPLLCLPAARSWWVFKALWQAAGLSRRGPFPSTGTITP